MTRAIDESIQELEAMIESGKDEDAIRLSSNIKVEIERLSNQKEQLIYQLRDPLMSDFDVLKEASDKNLASLEKEVIRECLEIEMDKYPPESALNPNTHYQRIKLDDSLVESYEKLLKVLGTLRLKPIHLTDDAEKAEYILVESNERKLQVGDKAITTKELGKYWGITFNL